MVEPKTVKYPSIEAALVAFQANIPVITKDSSADTGKYSYDYASLDKMTPVIFKALSAVGLAYTASPHVRKDGVFGLKAQLVHESGAAIGGFYPLGNPNNPAQVIGSAITYARRYALLSLTGVAPTGEDDDGAKASEAAAAAPAEPAAPKAGTAADLRKRMGEYIAANSEWVEGSDANDILSRLTDGKPPAGWTATDLKKAQGELEALVAEKKAAAK